MDVEGTKRSTSYNVKTVCVIIGGILVHLCLGSFYIFGNISPYMISYLRNRTSEISLRNTDNLWISNAASLAGPFSLTIGGLLDRYLGVRIATAVGCTLYCAGVGLTYFSIKKSLLFVALSYGLLANFGSFIAYGPPAQTAIKWLPERPTFAVGMIVCGFGGGALIFNQVVTAYINPDNLSPDLETADGEKYFTNKEVLDRIPKVFVLLAGIYVIAQFLGIILIFTHPSDKKVQKTGNKIDTKLIHDTEEKSKYGAIAKDEEDLSVNGENSQDEDQTSVTKESVKSVLWKVVRNKNAWCWLFILFLIYGGMTFFNSLYKAYGQTFISDDHFLASVGSISSIFNCIFRPIWGIIMDKYGFQMAVKCASALFVCFACTILHTESLGKAAFLVWICGLYASSACVWSIGPATFAKLFGVEHMAINMGFIFLAVTAAAITGGFVGLNLQSQLGWHGLFLLAGSMGATAFAITFLFNGKDTKGKTI
ncbi:uncharacterized protein LOC132748235 [Ruditapes philippinarum]|uniref:uncharacterized protein LOC132748235 n=1 Tax=Ruditapes philippinarum TaxID=129788 RepID=UPI00295BD47A|nr:uncharacterized protein LOC132748235 [Ruditapes philippinarum]